MFTLIVEFFDILALDEINCLLDKHCEPRDSMAESMFTRMCPAKNFSIAGPELTCPLKCDERCSESCHFNSSIDAMKLWKNLQPPLYIKDAFQMHSNNHAFKRDAAASVKKHMVENFQEISSEADFTKMMGTFFDKSLIRKSSHFDQSDFLGGQSNVRGHFSGNYLQILSHEI